ncbi:L-threonine ammonia-lyase isoform X2 [Octopus sinensis]|nr:L-threonine ammonia-lyase isoform X2 [Octopus sinensis]XP_036355997.1 L-threonine ammonia-lyase isoform X2 [Octopus sinensis]XP_036356002.1 L-threonine ammonia-lyase isoform X2 [Octopus sinensis]XP_036356008.1 L-threonine ammonia-lyase isoform X2 [Octopus sinensis]
MAEGSHVYIKCENLQRTGSFKVRGAFNKLCLLKESNPDIYKIGAVAASTGNHAMACTEAMNQLGIPVHVFVPETISPSKHERLIANKASLTVFGEDCMYAENAARKYSEEKGIPFISPYNDIDVIAGQGTIGLEIFEEQPDIENVFVPVGGGGLIAGIAAYLKQVNPNIKVIGCQPRLSKVMYESIKASTIIFEESQETLSDATSGGIEENSVTFDHCNAFVDDWILVEEETIAKAIYFMLSQHQMVIEGAAGVSLGAFMTNASRFAGQKSVIVACGANISMTKLKDIINTSI